MSYWLAFLVSDGDREDCNVFYSWLIEAKTEADATKKFFQQSGVTDPEAMKYYGFRKMDVIT